MRVLVVDDEEGILSFIGQVLAGEGLQVVEAPDGQAALALLEAQAFHLMITDLKMPKLPGMELVRRVRAEQPEMEVIVLTAHGTVESAVQAMKMGAFDFLEKPLSSPDQLRLVVARALERRRLRDMSARTAPPEDVIVAESPAMRAVLEQVRRVAATDATVLLTGESGTGKEIVARAVHAGSARAERPFVAVNCAALAENLLESEMFGHEKGAFSGATGQKRGRFELADTGTLFLDEVAELQTALQVKLLRVLQERSFERVGGTRTLHVDIRLVAATNRDLAEEMRAGRFREDLYHRLAVFPIHLAPLRERPEDIAPLAELLLRQIGAQMKRPGLHFGKAALAALQSHVWPGNVRELKNAIERAAIMAEGELLEEVHFGIAANPRPAPQGTLRDLEREAIRQALEAEGGHRKRAAARLGIGLRTLYDKLREYGLG